MFNAPLSRQRAIELIHELDLAVDSEVIDLGCGEGAFLQLMAQQQPIVGLGIDNSQSLIQRANEQTADDDSIRFVCDDASVYVESCSPMDLVVCIGAEFVFGGYGAFLDVAKPLLKPEGQLLIGTIYWKQTPTDDYLTLLGGQNPYFDLATTLQMAVDQGYVPLMVQRSNDDEWDRFESRTARKRYTTALQINDEGLREKAWQWQRGYLQWGKDMMGFCFLILQML